jgi:hypothetical protein
MDIPIVILIVIVIPIVFLFSTATVIPAITVIVVACSPLLCPHPLALPLPGWTPLGLYNLRLHHPGHGRTRMPQRGFATHEARTFTGAAPPWDTPK